MTRRIDWLKRRNHSVVDPTYPKMDLLMLTMQHNWDMLRPHTILAVSGTARRSQHIVWGATNSSTQMRAMAIPGRLQRSLGHRLIEWQGRLNLWTLEFAINMWKRNLAWKEGWWYGSNLDYRGHDIRDIHILWAFGQSNATPKIHCHKHIWKFGPPTQVQITEGEYEFLSACLVPPLPAQNFSLITFAGSMDLMMTAMDFHWNMLTGVEALLVASTARQPQRSMWTATRPGTTIRTAADPRRLQHSLGHRLIGLERHWDIQRLELVIRLWLRARREIYRPPTVLSHAPHFLQRWYDNPVDALGVDIRDLRNLQRFRSIEVGPRLRPGIPPMPSLQSAYEQDELYGTLLPPDSSSDSDAQSDSSDNGDDDEHSEAAESEEMFW